MAKPTGYKATRLSVAERSLEARKRVWREADVPPRWGRGELADPKLVREMWLRLNPDAASRQP